MKRGSQSPKDDIRPEYDFASMQGGVRGKYTKQYRAGTNLVLIEPALARAFPNDAAVNAALRVVLEASKLVKPPRKAAQPKTR